jgi:hypothetical protein
MTNDQSNNRKDSWSPDEAVRRRRLREDARRPMAVNLAETIALSEFVSSFAGSAWRANDR